MKPSTTPRIVALPPEHFTAEQVAIAGNRTHYNFTRVMVQHPAAYRAYIPYAEQLMVHSTLPLRDREILILRTLQLCRESYDLPHHIAIARSVGLDDDEIRSAQSGGSAL